MAESILRGSDAWTSCHSAVALCATALGLTGWAFGGWAVITVDDFPEVVTAAQPIRLSFMVRQHGITPLGNLSPRVTATDGKTEVDAPVRAVGRAAITHRTSFCRRPEIGRSPCAAAS